MKEEQIKTPNFERLKELGSIKVEQKLSDIKNLLNLLDNPQNKLKIIHVGGTNGKGSTTQFISKILEKHDFKVGVYNSPFVIDFFEVFKINSIEITLIEVEKLLEEIFKKVDKYNDSVTDDEKILPTYYEYKTVLAFQYFEKEKVDYAVIEVLMGGLFDATNVMKNSLISVITNVSLDHTKFLGNTVLKIGKEKVGILKNDSKLITFEENKEVLKIFKNACEEKNSKLICLKKEIFKELESNLDFQEFEFQNQVYRIKLLGSFQIKNCVLALRTLQELGLKLLENVVKKAVLETLNIGRLKVYNKNPLIMIDGAHNSEAFKELFNFLEKQINLTNNSIFFAISSIEKLDSSFLKLLSFFKKIHIGKSNFRPVNQRIIFKKLEKIFPNKEIKIINEVEIFLQKFLENKNCEKFLLITGSIYFIGESLKFMKKV